MPTIPSVEEVDRIAAVSEPILRNLHITQAYYELSAPLVPRLGRSANWCTFATWASRQAGQTIRREDLAQALDGLFGTAPETKAALEVLVRVARRAGARSGAAEIRRWIEIALQPSESLARAADAVARGNRKVFAEIGREFARFGAHCQEDQTYRPENIEAFCTGLREGPPPEGQAYLRQAFAHYYRAFFEPDAKKQSELMLLANLEIGLHEQTRLQPEIAEALDAAVVDPDLLASRLLGAFFPWQGRPLYVLLRLMRVLGRPTLLDRALQRLVTAVRKDVRRFLTDHLMVLCFPQGMRLRLGDDLNAAFAPSLEKLANADLNALLDRIDPTADSLRDSGTADWANLPDRLHYIADLFRCYQESPLLLEPPFSPIQAEEIKMGRLPSTRPL